MRVLVESSPFECVSDENCCETSAQLPDFVSFTDCVNRDARLDDFHLFVVAIEANGSACAVVSKYQA